MINVSRTKRRGPAGSGRHVTTTLTLRSRGAHLIVTGPALSGVAKFKTRRQAREWCARYYPCISIHEVGAESVKRTKRTKKFGMLR
jgi:hypothetical protein